MCAVGLGTIGPGAASRLTRRDILAAGPGGKQEITPAEVKELLVEGRSPLIEDFISKRGNKFAAHLVLSAKKDKAEFEFAPR